MLRLTPYRQRPGFCGPASLKIVLSYFGVEKTEEELARIAGATGEHGVDALGIVKAAEHLGLSAEIKDHARLDDIKKCLNDKIPPIVDWFSQDDGHYSVVAGMDETNIYLEDPELGQQRAFRHDVFLRLWFDFPGDYIKSKDELILRRIIVIKPNQ